MVKDRINLLSGHPSTGYPVVAAIKTVAMLFVIILAVQGVFHSPYYFCGLYGYFVVGTNPQELTEEASLQELQQKEQTYRIFAVFNSLAFVLPVMGTMAAGLISALLGLAWSDEELAKKRGSESHEQRTTGSKGTKSQQRGNGCLDHREAEEAAKKGGSESHRQSAAGSKGTRLQPKENGCLIPREAGDRKTRTQEDEESARKRRTEASPLLGGSESTPYLWQFTEADYHTWKNFGPSDNVVLEAFSSDVNNVEVEIELEDTRIRQSGTLSGKISVNFQTMSMSLILRSVFDPSMLNPRTEQ
ncbi:uncharacterized protein [Pocillopora verrucosa]|uniref:uncharacterized protein isoform X3 n=1 Tax=Pocillopora verrucosa TaxID=203993 RepID=UPI00333ED60B